MYTSNFSITHVTLHVPHPVLPFSLCVLVQQDPHLSHLSPVSLSVLFSLLPLPLQSFLTGEDAMCMLRDMAECGYHVCILRDMVGWIPCVYTKRHGRVDTMCVY